MFLLPLLCVWGHAHGKLPWPSSLDNSTNYLLTYFFRREGIPHSETPRVNLAYSGDWMRPCVLNLLFISYTLFWLDWCRLVNRALIPHGWGTESHRGNTAVTTVTSRDLRLDVSQLASPDATTHILLTQLCHLSVEILLDQHVINLTASCQLGPLCNQRVRGGVRVFARAVFDLDPPWELVPDHGYYTNRRRLPRSPRPQTTIESLVNHAFTTPICF